MTATTVTQIAGHFMSDRDLIVWSAAARKAVDRLYWAREDLSMYHSLTTAFPGCRAYRSAYAEALREEEATSAASEAALDRALLRWQRLHVKAA